MAQKTDLYTVLNIYARKNNSPQIEMETFISFLEKYAKRIAGEKPEWTKWTEETGTRVWMDANRLAEDQKVLIQNDETGSWIYLSYYFAEQIKDTYKNPDQDSTMPFPNEVSLNIEIPQEQLRPLDVSIDLPRFLEEDSKEVQPIVKLIFPNEHGTALIPTSMIPITLLEFSILKIRNYLQRLGNREYIHRKLSPQLAGKEDHLREILDKIMLRPGDSINDLKTGREILFSFWAHFCNIVKADLSQKKELLSEELGALQATYIVEVCSNFFKRKALRAKEIELAFKSFELEIEKPPYYFSRDAIIKFKNNKGIPLLSYYTLDGLDAYIKKRITDPATPNELPDLLYFYTENSKSWLVKKTKLLQLCARLLSETRPVIVKIITRRWKKMMHEFLREEAMEDDNEFEKLIASYVDEYAPMLKTLLKDKRLFLVYDELKATEKGIPDSSELYKGDELLPLHVLLLLKRKQLISDIKLILPFWYSVPIISSIIAFFVNLGKKRKKRKEAKKTKNFIPETEDDILEELRNTAEQAAAALIPQGKNLNSYLEVLASRWGLLLNRQAKENLVDDVNSLVRDKLRQLLRYQKNVTVNSDTLDKLTNAIMDGSKGLLQITEQNTLFQYIKLYIIKLLLDRTVM